MGSGKWIAGALGWAMFGPIGGILGYYFVSRIERFVESAGVYGEEQSWNQGQRNSFLMSLLVLSAAVIKADGKATSQELATLRTFFSRNFGPQAGNEAESSSAADVVGHVGRDDHGDFHKTGHLAVLLPRSLIYHLPEAVLFDSVSVGSSGLKELTDDFLGTVVMTAHEVLSDKVSMRGECLLRLIVHIQYDSFAVTYGNCTVHFFCPIRYHILI